MMYETLNCSNVFGWFELGAAVVVRSCLFFEVQIMRFGICFFFWGGGVQTVRHQYRCSLYFEYFFFPATVLAHRSSIRY